MHLAIAAENVAVAIDQDCAIVAATIRRQLGIADIKADAERMRAIEQRLDGRVRHAALEILVEHLAFEEPAWKEGRKRKLRKHHEACAAPRCLLQELEHPGKRMLARVRFLRRPHLGGGSAKDTNQGCLHSVRAAASIGERTL
jgi:hypothetical protein